MWGFFWVLTAVLLLAVVGAFFDTTQDESLKPYLELSGQIRRAYGCARVTLRDGGTKEAPRLSAVYVVGEKPTLADPQKEMKAISDLVFLMWKGPEIAGIDVERRVPRSTGGCDETFDSTKQSFERPQKKRK